MAVTSLWARNVRVEQVIDYVRNPDKVTDSAAEQIAALHEIDGVIEYATDELKNWLRLNFWKRRYIGKIPWEPIKQQDDSATMDIRRLSREKWMPKLPTV